MKKKLITQGITILIFISIMFGIMYFANIDKPGYTITKNTGTEYEKAKVIEVIKDNTTVDEKTENVLKGDMELKLEILTGRYKGEICEVTNYFSALYNVIATKGDTISVRIDTTGDNEFEVSVYNYNRQPLMIGLVLVFFLALALIGGKQGIKAFVGLVYTVLCICFILLPLVLKGFSPIYLTCGIAFLTTIFCFYLIGGIQIKTVSAVLGSMSGVIIAALLGQLAAYLGGVTTFQTEEAEALLLAKSSFDLNIKGLFTSAIIIAAIGAVMDISMTISSALEEIYEVDNTLSFKKLFKTGMNIGRDAMGTMANTLVLAYVGSSLNMMVLIYSYGVSLIQLINTDFVAIEMIRAVAGSVGIICTVPSVSAISALLLSKKTVGFRKNKS